MVWIQSNVWIMCVYLSCCILQYLNAGPGGIAGFFVHEKHADNSKLPRYTIDYGQTLPYVQYLFSIAMGNICVCPAGYLDGGHTTETLA